MSAPEISDYLEKILYNQTNSIGLTNIVEIGGEPQSAVDVADKIDQIEDALVSVGTDELQVDITSQSTGNFNTNIDEIGGQDQSAVDVADKIDQLEDALESIDGDELRVTRYGDQLDGDRVPVRADGVAFETDAELNANEEFTSPWIDTDGFRSIEVFISSDQPSAPGGIIVEFTDNAQTSPPQVRGTVTRRYDSAAVSRGFVEYKFATILDGFRVRYVNGGTATSDFYLASTVRLNRTSPSEGPLNSEIEAKDTIQFNRSVVAGQDSNDNTKNVRVENMTTQFQSANGPVGMVTYGDRALQNFADDQVRVDLENNNADVATETTVNTINNNVDEVETKLDTVISELQDIEADLEAEADAAFVTSETLPANGTIERTLSALGGSNLNGHFLCTGTVSLRVQWLDDNSNVIREQVVINNAIPDDWKTFTVEPASPNIKLILEDDSGSNQTANASYHYN